jgi:hypothetical protein
MPVSGRRVTLIRPQEIRWSGVIQSSLPCIKCDHFPIGSQNVGQSYYPKEQAAPVESEEFLSLEIIQCEGLDEILIATAVQSKIWSPFNKFNIQILKNPPGVGDPTVRSQLPETFIVRQKERSTKTQFQFCSFHASVNKLPCDRDCLTILHEGSE